MTRTPYATREDVKAATDVRGTSRDAAIDRALRAGTESIDRLTGRSFAPTLATRYFRWPAVNRSTSWRLWLGSSPLISLAALTSGAGAIPPSALYLEPANDGPPFHSVEINTGTAYAFDIGATSQRDIAVTGLFGWTDDATPAGALAAAIVGTTSTTITVTDGSSVGVGSLLRIDTERVLVTGRTWTTSGQTLGSTIGASSATVAVPVGSGVAFTVGESVLIDSERMTITDITGNTLTVDRAQDGSPLAGHSSGATVYVSRLLTIERGAAGTAAATHLNGAPLTTWEPPAGIRELCTAEAIVRLQDALGAYAGSTGNDESKQSKGTDPLAGMRAQVRSVYGRIRSEAV